MKNFIRSIFFIQTLLVLNSLNINAQTFAWANSINTALGSVNLFGISVDLNGNSYVTGDFQGTITLGTIQITSYGLTDMFIAKYNSNGNCLWAKHAGGVYWDNNPGFAGIAIDTNGNSYITGCFTGTATFDTVQIISYGPNSIDIFIAMYDSIGNCVWAKHAGGNYIDYGYAISVDKKGNSYITGPFEGTAHFGTISLSNYGPDGYSDIFIAKYDHYGNCLWAKHAGGNSNDGGAGITVDAYGNSYITGDYDGIAKFDTIQLTGGGFFTVIEVIPEISVDLFGIVSLIGVDSA